MAAASLNKELELLMGTTTHTPSSADDASIGKSLASCFPNEFPYEFDSVPEMASGDESVVEGDIEEEEDAFFAGLTRRLTQQQLAAKPERKQTVAGSPESTLCGMGGCWSVSSNGSPNGAPSPTTTPSGEKNDTLVLIHAAAGEIARLKMATRNTAGDARAPCGTQLLPDMAPKATTDGPNTNGFLSGQTTSHRASQFLQYQKQSQLVGQQRDQLLKQQYEYLLGKQQPQRQVDPILQPPQQQLFHFNGGRGLAFAKTSSGRPLGVPPQSAWGPPHLHQQHIGRSSIGMRSAYLGGSVGVKRERAGTGVFLPRKYGTNPAPDSCKKKAGGSTVLLPAGAVQDFALNFDDRNLQGQGLGHFRPNCGLGLSDYDVVMARRTAFLAQQKQSLRPEAMVSHEQRLPQEWTY